MKKYFSSLFVMLLITNNICAQYVIKSLEELNNLKKVPQEKVYVNHTGPITFTGEYVYYSFQCFNAQNNRLSDISKVGYLALISEDKSFVFEQKIKLKKGLGQGDFFIPTDLPSGNYKLMGYTQWMKNNGLPQVFQDDLVIINPYAANQESVLSKGPKNLNKPYSSTFATQEMDSSTVGLLMENSKFGKRQKVNFSLKNYKGYLGNGSYSIKVKKRSNFGNIDGINAINYAKTYFNVDKEINLNVGDSIFLPEQRGELLFGNVKDANSGNPIVSTPVVISLPGKEFVLKFATTNANGNFYTYLRKDYKENMAIIQLEGSNTEADIEVKSANKLNVAELQFGDFNLDEGWIKAIKKRSIHNQIENQFFTKKPDSILLGDPIDPFDGGTPEVLMLDDYTRFPTFQETLVEIVNNAGYRNNGKENDYVRIAQDFETFNEEYNSFPAIVLFDGVYITNHEAMKGYDARKIKSISLIRDQFQLANKQYQGIMAVETFDGDFYNTYNSKNGTLAQIVKPLPEKNYFIQNYQTNEFDRVPDYRTLLFWKPNIVVDDNSYDFEFYTSDVEGEFEILVDGFTTYGKPISFSRSITVD